MAASSYQTGLTDAHRSEPPRTDLLRWPLIGPVLRWHRLRTVAQLGTLAVAVVIVMHGLMGPQLAPRNLATVVSWIHYRGLLIGTLLLLGNVFCHACPMVLVRDLGRRLHTPRYAWPRWLGGKRVAIVGMAAFLFTYERFDLWALPAATAWLIIGYFAAALMVDSTFKGAAFCKHVCPVGQFNFLASTLSPTEVTARDVDVCRTCTTADCIKGRREPATAIVVQRGCELGLFVPAKVGNLDCTFCLDCVQACPHDNIAIAVRVPGEELVDESRRSSIGRLARRRDLALLAVLFTAGALLNAFAMVEPVYAVMAWLSGALRTASETLVLGVVFIVGLAVVPWLLCVAAAMAVRWLTGQTAPSTSTSAVAMRYAYALVPLGVGIWLAHYGFHFLTGVGTIVPVAQSAVADLTAREWLGQPDWRWVGMRPGLVFPLQLGAVALGAMGSLLLVHSVSEHDSPSQAGRASMPWLLVVLALAALAVWVLSQPMEMRGTGLQ